MSWAINWLVRPIFGVFVGQVFIHALHLVGFFPDRSLARWIAQMVVEPSAEVMEVARWGLAAAIGLALLSAHEVYRRQQLRAAAPAAQNNTATDGHTSGASVRDVDLSEALAYVVFREWGHSFYDVVSSPEVDGAAEYDAAIQAAADGHLPVWGRRQSYGVLEPIPAEYWRDHSFDWFSLLRGDAHTEAARSGPRYESLMTSRSAVERQWPRADRAR